MGQPVKIIDLAETMIRLSGLSPSGTSRSRSSAPARARSSTRTCSTRTSRPADTGPEDHPCRARAARSGVGRGDLRGDQPARARGRRGGARRACVEARAGAADVRCCQAPGPPRRLRRSMASIPFALSVHNFINSVGADAGFASIIGLAILVLLYFAQARETSSLREQRYEAASGSQQLRHSRHSSPRQPGLAARAGAPAMPARPRRPPAVGPAAGACAATAAPARTRPPRPSAPLRALRRRRSPRPRS